jgi:hypothetical protein
MTQTLQLREGQTEIECLGCGTCRLVTGLSTDELGMCPICGYVGWTLSDSITESELRSLQHMHAALRFAAAT